MGSIWRNAPILMAVIWHPSVSVSCAAVLQACSQWLEKAEWVFEVIDVLRPIVVLCPRGRFKHQGTRGELSTIRFLVLSRKTSLFSSFGTACQAPEFGIPFLRRLCPVLPRPQQRAGDLYRRELVAVDEGISTHSSPTRLIPRLR